MRKVVTLVSLVLVVCASATVIEAQTVSAPRQTNVYTYLAPLTLVLIASELIYLGVTRKKLLSFQEAIANLGTALGNQTMNVLIAASVYLIYGYLWQHYRVYTISLNVYTFIVLLILMDFFSYWVHRWGHAINLLWAIHSPHHSAEEMNIFVGLRASVTQRVFTFSVLWPLTLIGFTPFDIYLVNGIHLFIALFQHVTWTGKTERLGIVFNTPSHHRVHHAVNQQYLDKNFSDFLIVWDKLFGTFEPEREKVVYGMYNPPRSWNPLKINFHYFGVIWRDAVATRSWLDKVRVWFMPAGWRPRDLPPFNHKEINEHNQIKYRSTMFARARSYLILQAVTAIPFTVMIISAESALSNTTRWIGGALLWMQIVNWGGILEARKWAWISELVRLVLTSGYLLWIFPHNQFAIVLVVALAAYSLLWTSIYFRPGSGSALLGTG
jgi:sterol desaturase/sphingolipid hydroxylase (fatty acid hydroxylase superfamily)